MYSSNYISRNAHRLIWILRLVHNYISIIDWCCNEFVQIYIYRNLNKIFSLFWYAMKSTQVLVFQFLYSTDSFRFYFISFLNFTSLYLTKSLRKLWNIHAQARIRTQISGMVSEGYYTAEDGKSICKDPNAQMVKQRCYWKTWKSL